MERIPYYILCEIITSVGPINEIYQLSLVCKGWYRAMKNSLHLGTMAGYNMNTRNVWKYRMKFLAKWKLYELNFQGSCLFPSKSFIEVINVSQPKVLNLSSCSIPDFSLCANILCRKKSKHGNENSFCSVEELRITNLAREYYDEYEEKIIGYGSYKCFNELFPNLKKLYAGNTGATQEDLVLVISKLKRLELLDISNCSSFLGDIEENSLNCILSSNLKTLFISLKDQSHIVDIIQSKGIKVITNNLGDILRNAIEEESSGRLEEWLKSGGDPNVLGSKFKENQIWEKPLFVLIKQHIDEDLLKKIIRIMIKNGANFSHDFFCAAISKNMIWLVKRLMSSGCNVWYKTRNLNTSKENKEFVALTLAAKVACEAMDFSFLNIFADNGFHKLDFFECFTECNPYCIAIEKENIELFSYLIHKGFSIWKCKDRYKPEHLTPLIFHPIILDYALLSGNFSLGQFPFDWVYDGLRYCISKNKQKEVSRLLEYLIPLGIKEKEKLLVKENRSTSFCCLYKSLVALAYNHNKGCKQMLEYLIEQGFDINNVCEYETPLFIEAAEYGDLEMMIYFYNNGAKINHQNLRGLTALHEASRNGHEEAVMQLINWGACTSIKSNNGHTALELAKMNNRTKICLLLQKKVCAYI